MRRPTELNGVVMFKEGAIIVSPGSGQEFSECKGGSYIQSFILD